MNLFDTEVQFLNLDLSKTDLIFMINKIIFSLKFHFLDRDVLSLPSFGLYISQLVFRFTRVCLNIIDFNNNKEQF